ncbi:ABC transporter ATP-binding protein [Gleimia hominis]|uniref:ABC transporter ATP-binding protein n=1 Tax=Gleimia hominis TaxID=595468 RepID=A0ABU3ICP3_9ACTO|nr:ABC transporter ATP-binding protein [Gleimia hominis]MDT3768146.1 ABC transporter ATP-binding protein [Gleimia hominis]
MIIQARELVCGYKPGHPIIGPISLGIKRGSITCIVGPNGIGKTTLFKTLLGLLKPLSGSFEVSGKDASQYSAKEFARKVAYVPQSHIPPFPFTVEDFVVMGTNPHLNELASPGEGEFEVARRALANMGISHLAKRDYTQISGGERQLVVIARGLAQQAELIMMDEPTASLDFGNQVLVLQRIQRLSESGYTIIFITHDPTQAFTVANEVVALGRNSFVQAGKPSDVLTETTLSDLYGVDVQVAAIRVQGTEVSTNVCIPAQLTRGKRR